MAEKKNLEIYRGDSKSITVTFSPNAAMVDNGIVWFTMKNAKDNTNCDEPENQCIFQTHDTVEQILDNDNNIIGYQAVIYMPPADTNEFNIKSYVYDIQVVGEEDDPQHPGNPILVKTLVEGKFIVLEDVTRKTA
jgi:hypothetical protein